MNNEIKSKGNLKRTELVFKSREMIDFLKRDQKELLSYGVTIDRIAKFEHKLGKALSLDVDVLLAEDKVKASEKKSGARELLMSKLKLVSILLKDVYGKQMAEYRYFGLTLIERKKDADLALITRRLIKLLTKRKDSLTDGGITEALIDIIQKLNDDFMDSIDDKKDMVGRRDIATEKRTLIFNELYEELSKFSEIGKSHWRYIDKDKYEEYKLYAGRAEKYKKNKTDKNNKTDSE